MSASKALASRAGFTIGVAVLLLAATATLAVEVADQEPTVAPSAAVSATPIRIGAVFPRSGDAGALAAEELRGIQIAVDLVNAGGGVNGVPVTLEVHGVDSADQALPVLDALRAEGVQIVLGAYSSELSIPVSAAVSARGMVYWETGAVADQLTGRDLPNVFRVGASSTTLGTDSGAFTLEGLAPLLGRKASELRVAIVHASDDYAAGVAAAADSTLTAGGASIVARLTYPVSAPLFAGVLDRLRAVKPDVIVLASHIPDGIAFREQMIAAGLHTGALIGTTMAECVPDFAAPLGQDAVGIFGSDRPSGAFNASALAPNARSLYDQFAERFTAEAPTESPSGSMSAWPTDAGQTLPQVAADAAPSSDPWAGSNEDEVAESALEEGVSGFSAGWALLHDVLPVAAEHGQLTVAAIADAARGVDLPPGSLPNGGGLHFSSDPQTLGQNERAIGLIQQWQAPNDYKVVWPATFATAPIRFVPLPR